MAIPGFLFLVMTSAASSHESYQSYSGIGVISPPSVEDACPAPAPEWKCKLDEQYSSHTGSLFVYQCRSLYGETESVPTNVPLCLSAPFGCLKEVVRKMHLVYSDDTFARPVVGDVCYCDIYPGSLGQAREDYEPW